MLDCIGSAVLILSVLDGGCISSSAAGVHAKNAGEPNSFPIYRTAINYHEYILLSQSPSTFYRTQRLSGRHPHSTSLPCHMQFPSAEQEATTILAREPNQDESHQNPLQTRTRTKKTKGRRKTRPRYELLAFFPFRSFLPFLPTEVSE